MSKIAHHMTTTATETATSAVNGNISLVCTTARVTTPVIVPGLAAKRISGVSAALLLGPVLVESLGSVWLPRNIEKPIHDNKPPPATENASRDTPKTCRMLAPHSAASTRITRTASAALVASASCALGERVPSIRAKIAPHISGLTKERTVTIA